MKTKKTVITLFGALAFLLTPATLIAQDSDKPFMERMKDKVVIQKVERTSEMENRLNEISNMDMSDLDRPEKRALKKEVREIQKKTSTKAGGAGIYISAGGLLLLIILLIILL